MARQWWAVLLLALASPSHAGGGRTVGSRALAVRGGAESREPSDYKFSVTVHPAPAGLPYESFDAATQISRWEPYPTHEDDTKGFDKKLKKWSEKWADFHAQRKPAVYEEMFLRGHKPNEESPFGGLTHPRSWVLRTRFATFDKRKNLDPKAYNYFTNGDVRFVKLKTGCSDDVAVAMIGNNGGNLINAIMEIENLGLVENVE